MHNASQSTAGLHGQRQQQQQQRHDTATADSTRCHCSSRSNMSRGGHAVQPLVAAVWLLLLLLDPACNVTRVAAGASRLYNTTAGRSPGKLTVHLMPHAHLDPGWLHTFEGYFNGWAFKPPEVMAGPIDAPEPPPAVAAGVSHIIDSVVGALLLNPDRTFTFADIAFFATWWAQQPGDMRDRVRGLVASGQLQFVNGGLVQHDEATSHYSSIVDQMGAGMRFLAQELGVEPRVAWMLDDFGHSRSEPLLRTQGGFEALFVTRIDKQDLSERKRAHQTELLWRGSPAFGRESDLWLHVSPTATYSPFVGDWIKEDPLSKATLPEAVLLLDDGSEAAYLEAFDGRPNVVALLNQLYWKARAARDAAPEGTTDVLMYFGADFAFKDALAWFEFSDALLHYANREGVMNVQYSTAGRFLAAKKTQLLKQQQEAAAAAAAPAAGSAAEAAAAAQPAVKGTTSSGNASDSSVSVRLAVKSDDFLPLRDEDGKYWTGFYSSRPALKGIIRTAAAVLQATRQLEVIAGLNPSSKTLATNKGPDLLQPRQPSGAAAVRSAAAAAAAAVDEAQRQYTAASAAADALNPEQPQKQMSNSSLSSSGDNDGDDTMPPELQQRLHHAADALRAAAEARAEQFVTAAEEHEAADAQVAEGPDTAVLEFAVGLAHHHDAITGTQRQYVQDDYIDWLHVGLQRAVPKMLLALQRLVFARRCTSGSSSSSSSGAAAAARKLSGLDAADDAPAEGTSSDDDSSSSDSSSQPPSDVISLSHPLPGLILSGVHTDSASQLPPALPPLSYCLLLNVSLCSATVQLSRGDSGVYGGGAGGSSSRGFLLVVYNALSRPRTQGVRLPVDAAQAYTVTGPGGVAVPSQLLPLPPHAQQVWQASGLAHLASSTHANTTTAQLAVQVEVPALGHAVYRVEAVGGSGSSSSSAAQAAVAQGPAAATGLASSSSSMRRLQLAADGDHTVLSNGALEVTVSNRSRGITHVKVLSSGRQYNFSSSLAQYAARELSIKPGAYVFSMRSYSEFESTPPELEVFEGPVVTEVRQVWGHERWRLAAGESLSLVTRLWKGSAALEVEWTAGPPTADANWELFLRYQTDLATGGVWFTDASGLEWQQRRLGYRPAYSYTDTELPGNLYPMTTGALLREASSSSPGSSSSSSAAPRSLAVSTERAQGVTSLQDGQLSVLLHRTSLDDDGLGMEEPLTDSNVAVGRHTISFGGSELKTAAAAAGELHARHHQQALNDPLQLAFSPLPPPADTAEAHTCIREASSFLAAPATATAPAAPAEAAGASSSRGSAWPSLPPSAHVLSLQWHSCSTVLVRLVNTFQAGEASQAVLSSLWRLFDWGQAQAKAAAEAAAAGGETAGSVPAPWSAGLTVTDVREVTLFGGNRPLTDSDLQPPAAWAPAGEHITKWEPALWPAAGGDSSSGSNGTAATAAAAASAAAQQQQQQHSFLANRIVGPVGADVEISLAPMQIRSFLVTVRRGGGGSSSSGGAGGGGSGGQDAGSSTGTAGGRVIDLRPYGVVAMCEDEAAVGQAGGSSTQGQQPATREFNGGLAPAMTYASLLLMLQLSLCLLAVAVAVMVFKTVGRVRRSGRHSKNGRMTA